MSLVLSAAWPRPSEIRYERVAEIRTLYAERLRYLDGEGGPAARVLEPEIAAPHVSEGNSAARRLQELESSLRNDIYRSNTAKVELSSLIAQNQDTQAALRRCDGNTTRAAQLLGIAVKTLYNKLHAAEPTDPSGDTS